MKEDEPAIHLLAGIVLGVDAGTLHDLCDMPGAPTVDGMVYPLEVFGREVEDIAVLVVTLGACTVGEDRAWPMKYGTDEDVAGYISEVSHFRIDLTTLPVVALPTGSSVRGGECNKNLSYSPPSA